MYMHKPALGTIVSIRTNEKVYITSCVKDQYIGNSANFQHM